MTVLALCEWLESTSLAVLIKESAYGFPIVVAAGADASHEPIVVCKGVFARESGSARAPRLEPNCGRGLLR